MNDLAAVAGTDPEAARRVLADVVESVVLKLSDEGNETAAIAGGRVLEICGCGGTQPQEIGTLRANVTEKKTPRRARIFPRHLAALSRGDRI
jgi:hypothetical protein